jgi:HTH-type transcriptional regulator / antitoxin MqsA
MTDTRVHPETGQTLYRDVRPQTVQVGSKSLVVDVPGWYPEGDGDAIFSGADLKASDEAFTSLQSAYAKHVKAVRKASGLTQSEAGRIIGGGPRAFQKYESGKVAPSDAAVGLIEVLNRHPEALATLKSIRSLAPSVLTTVKKAAGVTGAGGIVRRKSSKKTVRAQG